MSVSFQTTVHKESSTLNWACQIRIPAQYATPFLTHKDRRVICHINQEVSIQRALMSHGEGNWYIMLNQQLWKKLGFEDGDAVQITLEKDESEYGMEMPEELEVMLLQEPSATSEFKKLTPGKQRSLIHIVAKVKNTNSRINKALAIVHHLKECEGTLDFKRLNVLIKHYNNR